jgi:hypothetical protein
VKKKMAARKNLALLLKGGDRRSLGRTKLVVKLALKNAKLFPQLLECMWSDNPVLRMRVADAAEKISRQKPELLHPFKVELLGLAEESTQQEVRWHLALMIPRLELNSIERRRAVVRLKEYLQDRSSVVKTHALQGLSELAKEDEELLAEVLEVIAEASRNGTAAMKARARQLLSSQQN